MGQKMNLEPISCGNCIFFTEKRCHRFPPQVWADPEHLDSCFPVVLANDWCGEFKRKGAVLFPKGDENENQD
jgi:hypothetical protein